MRSVISLNITSWTNFVTSAFFKSINSFKITIALFAALHMFLPISSYCEILLSDYGGSGYFHYNRNVFHVSVPNTDPFLCNGPYTYGITSSYLKIKALINNVYIANNVDLVVIWGTDTNPEISRISLTISNQYIDWMVQRPKFATRFLIGFRVNTEGTQSFGPANFYIDELYTEYNLQTFSHIPGEYFSYSEPNYYSTPKVSSQFLTRSTGYLWADGKYYDDGSEIKLKPAEPFTVNFDIASYTSGNSTACIRFINYDGSEVSRDYRIISSHTGRYSISDFAPSHCFKVFVGIRVNCENVQPTGTFNAYVNNVEFSRVHYEGVQPLRRKRVETVAYIDLDWGGILREIYYGGLQWIDNFDPGRNIENVFWEKGEHHFRDANQGGCQGVEVDKGDFGSTVTEFIRFSSYKCRTKCRALDFGNSEYLTLTPLEIEQTTEILSNGAIKVDVIVRNLSNTRFDTKWSEFPCYFSTPDQGIFYIHTYEGSNPWRNDPSISFVDLSSEPLNGLCESFRKQLNPTENWASLTNSIGDGLTFFLEPRLSQDVNYNCLTKGWGAHFLKYVPNSCPWQGNIGYFAINICDNLPANGSFSGTYYIMPGNYLEARDFIYKIISSSK